MPCETRENAELVFHQLPIRCSCCTEAVGSLHRQHTPEPDLAAQHVVHSLLSLAQWELLDHAFHTVYACKLDGFFRVQSMSGRPPMNRDPLQDHRHSVEHNVTDS